MTTESIDFTSRDFTSIRQDLLDRASVVMPEWTSRDESDFGVLMLEMWAYAADVLHYYVDRAANEAFIQTAVLRSSLLNLAALLDYRPAPQTAATATVTFTRTAGTSGDIIIPKGMRVFASPADPAESPIYFETDQQYTLTDGTNTVDADVTEGRTVTEEPLGQSTGATFQRYALYYEGVIDGTVDVRVYEGPPDGNGVPSAVQWKYVDRLIDNTSGASVFTTFIDENNVLSVIFGDGVTGRIPPVNAAISATYRYGVGAKGNVGPGSLVNMTTPITNLARVSNTLAAAGGSDRESIDSMRYSIPKALRAQDRAVTLDDYTSLALKVVGVAKANSYWNQSSPTDVTVYICPSTAVAPSSQLKTDVDNYLTERAVVGKNIIVNDPTYVPINITVSIVVEENAVQLWTQNAVEEALNDLLTFDKVSFA